MIRILVVVPFYKPAYVFGGPVRSVSTLCENLVKVGCDVTVYTTNADGLKTMPVVTSQVNCVHGVQVYYFETTGPSSYFYSTSLRKACFDHCGEFDLVYIASNWGYPFVPACLSAGMASVPYVISPRASFKRNTWEGKFAKKFSYHWLVERRLINRASALHYTTALERDDSLWLKLLPPDFVVPNPVNLAEFESLPSKGCFRAKYGIPSDQQSILFLGRVESAKGLDIALKSFAKVAAANPKACFIIAGPEEDGYGSILERLAVDLHIRERILLTGLLDSHSRLQALVDTDVLILTSYSENFGMSAVEAMAAGVPVLVSDRIGLADAIQTERIGVVVPLDVHAISCKLNEILSNHEHYRLVGQRAAQIVREKYAPYQMADAMLNRFHQILELK